MLNLCIKNPLDSNLQLTISLPDTATVEDLRSKVAENIKAEASMVRLIYGGKMLVAAKPLSSFGITDNSTIHISVKKAKVAVAKEPNPASPSSTQNTPTESGAQQAALSSQPLQPSNVTNNPTGSQMSLPNMPFPGLNLNSPESFSSMFASNPFFRSLLSNRDFVRNSIINSPMMDDILRENPEFAAHMQDPETIEMLVDLMSDPDKLQATMREVDSTITQLSTTPDGLAMLERLRNDMNRIQSNMQSRGGPAMDLFGLNGTGSSDEPTEEQVAGSRAAYEYLQHFLSSNTGDSPFGRAFFNGFSLNNLLGTRRFSEPGFPMTYSGMIYTESLADAQAQVPLIAESIPIFQNGGLDLGNLGGINMEDMIDMLRSNPMFSNVFREMASNPDIIRQQVNSPYFREMMRRQFGDSEVTSTLLNNPTMMADMLSRYISAFNNNGSAPSQAAATGQSAQQPSAHGILANLEQLRRRFTRELEEVHAMGIYGKDDEVLQLLYQYDGNLEYVLNILFQ